MKEVIKVFCVLTCFFISENVLSLKKWDRNEMRISFDHSDRSIVIEAPFIDYEFGPLGEHAYFEWANLKFTLDGKHYERLFRFQVVDRLKREWSWVCMYDKLSNAKIQFLDFIFSESGQFWKEAESEVCLKYYNKNNKCYFRVKWFVPDNFLVKDIQLTAKWYVNGLLCSEEIAAAVYPLSYNMFFNAALKTESKLIDQFENNSVIVCPERDAIVIRGVDMGEKINVYTASGQRIKSVIVKDNLVKIQLPVNHIYIVNLGHTRSIVAL